jgi:hypothetical protein
VREDDCLTGSFQVWINQGDIILLSLRDFQDDKADVIVKYTADEARNLKVRFHFQTLSTIANPSNRHTENYQRMRRSTRRILMARTTRDAHSSLPTMVKSILMISSYCFTGHFLRLLSTSKPFAAMIEIDAHTQASYGANGASLPNRKPSLWLVCD